LNRFGSGPSSNLKIKMSIINTWREIRPKGKQEWKQFLIIAAEVILGGVAGYAIIWLGCALS
jgi:hypothetical protein